MEVGQGVRRHGKLREATPEHRMNWKEIETPYTGKDSLTFEERRPLQGRDSSMIVSNTVSTRGLNVKRELDSLVTQMHSTGIRYEEAVRQFKRQYLIEVLRAHRGNQCKAADELGMHRNTLSRTMAELDLDIAEVRAGLKRPVRSERLIHGGLRQQVR
jgi:Fis family transcriptional regulator, factor for inversion stimulation protein